MNKLQSVRGTKDLYGKEIELFNLIIKKSKEISLLYGFQELSTPIFEHSNIFEKNLGDDSDIISKEIYKFKDKSDNFLTLRPEFTSAIIRAFINNNELQKNTPTKLFSYGPLFRYDRPQKGRQRQFHQVNYEVIGGSNNYLMDIEVLSLANHLIKEFDLSDKLQLQLNFLDNKENYQKMLFDYFIKYEKDLSDDSKNRLRKNPLRILDSKDKLDNEISKNAPLIKDAYSKEAMIEFNKILSYLEKLNIKYKINHHLVRGLDYYTALVFEFVTNDKISQNTLLAGGRYNNLVKKISKNNDTPAIGFAAGIERILLNINIDKNFNKRPISIIYFSPKEEEFSIKLADFLRKSNFYIEICYNKNFNKQLKRASLLNSKLVVFIGEEEVKSNILTIKDFDKSKEFKVNFKDLFSFLKNL